MEPAARPQRPRPHEALDPLLECLVVEPDDLGKPDRGTIATTAILERSDQLPVASNDAAGGPRARGVDQNGIVPVRPPRTAQCGRRPDMKRIGERAAILDSREHPPAAIMLEQRGIAGNYTGDQRDFLDPAVGKLRGAIKIDGSSGAAFRDHPHVARVFEHRRV